jgi:hypothetical protein
MSDVEFLEEGYQKSAYQSRQSLSQPQVPKTVRFLMRNGIVKTPAGGYYVIIGVTVLFFVLAAVVFYLYVL